MPRASLRRAANNTKTYTYSYLVGADLGDVLLGDGNAGVSTYEYATDAVQRYASSVSQE